MLNNGFHRHQSSGKISFVRKRRTFERFNEYKLGWLRDSLFFIAAIAIVFVVFRFLIGLSVVGGDSMYPTLKDGNVVMYLRIAGDYKPGDIVSMRVPSGDYYIKRVAAVGGEVVDIYDNSVHVDGKARDDSHAKGETAKESGAVIYPYIVREGNVFVLGDNREVSMDSRAFGEVNKRQIKGRIILRIGKDGIHTVE